MLNKLYELPKTLIASLAIGLGILFIVMNDPPHTFCDTQVKHFKVVQKGKLYKNPKDFHKEKSILERNRTLCEQESRPGSCYDYFLSLRRLLKDLQLLSKECAPSIYNTSKVKKALEKALILMTALAWREEVLTGKASKYNWLSQPELFLFCELKRKYSLNYSKESYFSLENKILKLLPVEKTYSLNLIKKKTILTEPCAAYR